MAKKPETFGPKTALKLSGVCAKNSLSYTHKAVRLPIKPFLSMEYSNSLITCEFINDIVWF